MVAGNQATLGVAIQSAQGTPAATSSARFFLAGGGLAATPNQSDVEETSSTRVRNYAFRTNVETGGTPSAWVRPDFIGYLLYGVTGAKTVTGAADPYSHAFNQAAALPWLTFWKDLGGGLFEQYVDCKVVRLLLESESQGILRCEFDIFAKTVRYQTAAEVGGAAAESGPVYVHADGKGAFKVEATAVSRIERASIEIQNNGARQYGDDIIPSDVTEGLLDITINTRETVTDFALYKRLVYGSAAPTANATPTRDVLELGGAPAGIDFKYTRQATPERSLQYTCTRLILVGLSGIEPNPAGDPIKAEATYKAYGPTGGGSPVTFTLKNSKTTYT